jgi:hypothetical protein
MMEASFISDSIVVKTPVRENLVAGLPVMAHQHGLGQACCDPRRWIRATSERANPSKFQGIINISVGCKRQNLVEFFKLKS